jgi:uncharacterized membrane protein YqhA
MRPGYVPLYLSSLTAAFFYFYVDGVFLSSSFPMVSLLITAHDHGLVLCVVSTVEA